jgi:hypothetical protein
VSPHGVIIAHTDQKSGNLSLDVKTVFVIIAVLLSGGGVVGTAGGWIGGKIPEDVRQDIQIAKLAAEKAEKNTGEIARDIAIIKEDRPRVQKELDDHESRLRKIEERNRLPR